MKIPIVKEGLPLIKLFLIFTIAGYILGKFSLIFYFFALSSLLFALFLTYFFRDPQREIVQDEKHILSPADGKIIEIEEREKIVKIFMSPLNVHIQRAPVSGEVISIEYKKGKFLPAQKSEASEKNEQNVIEIRDTRHEARDKIRGNPRDLEESAVICVSVKQIAGILVRRIICWKKVGDFLTQGEKIGMIMFGSQVDISLPENVHLEVKTGQKVKAGLTIIASLEERFKQI